jgi:hypothetical protein
VKVEVEVESESESGVVQEEQSSSFGDATAHDEWLIARDEITTEQSRGDNQSLCLF